MIRVATLSDVPSLVTLINLAYRVEDFFVTGDRIDATGVIERMNRPDAAFLVMDGDRAGTPRATVFLQGAAARGYFGLLAVDPGQQGRGLAKQIITEVERQLATNGCWAVEIDVVDLRVELMPFYEALGYRATGIAPFSEPAKLRRPAHLVVMSKPLRSDS